MQIIRRFAGADFIANQGLLDRIPLLLSTRFNQLVGEFMKHDSSAAYRTSQLNSRIYSQYRVRFSEFWESERHFFETRSDWKGLSMLDVGGASGGLGSALFSYFSVDFPYTCIDIDAAAISSGKDLVPQSEFILGSFPNDLQSDRKFDYVVLFAWFAQVTDWKTMLLSLCSRARRFVNIAVNVRLEGTTVVDPDVSYVYYLDSGIRVPEITHNLFELLNFCSHNEIGADRISFYGYTSRNTTSAFRPLPRNKQIQGNLLIELRQASAESMHGRIQDPPIGGISNEVEAALGGGFVARRPVWHVVIDGEQLPVP